MIEHVYRRAAQANGLTQVVVLTDDVRIADAVRSFGGNVQMTPLDCRSGTDRIAHAAKHWKADAVVNIQGDEPLIEPEIISAVARHLADHPNDPVVTVAAQADEAELANPNVVKVVLDSRGFALYFSRAPIPFARAEAPETTQCLKHIGIYGYQIACLLKIAALSPTPLEKTESLEQLRALESGIPIRVLRTYREVWCGVDTPEDLEETVRHIKSMNSLNS
jgi:3-deoxy-manno-octulosonate cytidylyltransferase (CMP-KDO synthetase)